MYYLKNSGGSLVGPDSLYTCRIAVASSPLSRYPLCALVELQTVYE